MSNTETRQLLGLDAFATAPLEGTPVAMVDAPAGLTAARARPMADELGGRVTAVLRGENAQDRRIDLYDAGGERERADHATVATMATLYARGRIETGSHTIRTPTGPQGVEVDTHGRAWVAQPDADIQRADSRRSRVSDVLGLDEDALAQMTDTLPIAVASTVRPYLVVPVTYLQALGQIDPAPAALNDLLEEADVDALCAFTFDTLAGHTLHQRVFAPAETWLPQPQTGVETLPDGTAAGAVAAYLRAYGAFDDEGPAALDGDPDPAVDITEIDEGVEVAEPMRADEGLAGVTAAGADVEVADGLPDELVVEAGHFLDRPAEVHVRTGTGIQVGGRAAIAEEGTIAVPPADDDDITVA